MQPPASLPVCLVANSEAACRTAAENSTQRADVQVSQEPKVSPSHEAAMLRILGNDRKDSKGLQPPLSITNPDQNLGALAASLKAVQQWLDQCAATPKAQHAQAMSVNIKKQEDPLEQQEEALRQTQLTEQAKQAWAGL